MKTGGGRNGGTPVYSRKLAAEICERLASGESLRAICRTDPRYPDEQTVRGWVIKPPPGAEDFASAYMQARELGYDCIAEHVLDIGNGDYRGPDGYVDNGAIQQARLLSDNRKWFLSKVLPKRYGDKVTQELVGDPNSPIVTRIELVPVAPLRLATQRRDQVERHEQDDAAQYARGSVMITSDVTSSSNGSKR